MEKWHNVALLIIKTVKIATIADYILFRVTCMLINRKEVEQIAVLAKLSVTDAEINDIAASLDSVVSMINHINEIDTNNIKPMANPMDAVQRLRCDEVLVSSNKEKLLSMATQTDADYYLVPTVIE